MGLWIMILAVLSVFFNEPLGLGMLSGIAFTVGLFVLWGASVVNAFRRSGRSVSAK